MGYVFQFTKLNRAVLSCTLVAFTLSSIPVSVFSTPKADILNNVNFAIREND